MERYGGTGLNDKGQLGNGSTSGNSNEPIQVKTGEKSYLTNVIDISCGGNFAVAATADGYVYVWGDNSSGQLGQGNKDTLYYATKMKDIDGSSDLKNIIQVSAGRNNIFAVSENGYIYGAGNGSCNQFGDNNLTDHTKTTMIACSHKAINVEAGMDNVYVMLENGGTYCWGKNSCGELGVGTEENKSKGIYNISYDIVDISTSGNATVIIDEEGKTYTTGKNDLAQLGLSDTSDRSTFTETLLSTSEVKAKYVLMSEKFMTILAKDGKVYEVGYNKQGQLSNGSLDNVTEFTTMKLSEGVDIEDVLLISSSGASKNDSTYTNENTVIRKDGTVWSSGKNNYGQLGNLTNADAIFLTQMGDVNAKLSILNEYIKVGSTIDVSVAEAKNFNVFIEDLASDFDFTWTSSNTDVATIDENGKVTGVAVGYTTITAYNEENDVKAKAIVNVYRNHELAITTPQVEIGNNFTIVLKEDGTVWRNRF